MGDQRPAGGFLQLDPVADLDHRHVRLRVVVGQVEVPAGLGRGGAVDAAAGMFMSTTGGPVFAFVAICFAAIGFKSASSLFWPIPQGYLDARIAAAVIALINSVGNLGGFVAPTTFGLLEQSTGSIQGGLYGLAVTSVLAAIRCSSPRPRPRQPDRAKRGANGRCHQQTSLNLQELAMTP
jgi:nitrate/nitrite transporter NarK